MIVRGFAVSLLMIASGASAAPKFIAHGWDLLGTTPEALETSAAAFGATSLDGVTVCVPETKQADGSVISSLSLPQDAPWKYESLVQYEPTLNAIVKYPSLKECFLLCLWRYRRGRLAWPDDAAWVKFAGNMRMFARLAKRGGMKGIFIDAEDYTKERQFARLGGDPDYADAAALARRRGREVFEGVFKEFPDATVLSFWFYSQCRSYLESHDPVAMARQEGDLWPHFMNGLLDAMPMTATLVDGDECAYKYDSGSAFDDGAIKQTFKAIPLVAPENRDKFRARMRVGFGQYIDMYVNEKGKCGSWYFGPVAGSRLEHFRQNLSYAAHTAEYVWLYGEKFSWVDWKREAVNPANSKWEYSRHKTWESQLPGLAAMLSELRDPIAAAQQAADHLRVAGSTNLYTANVKRRWTWFDPKKTGGTFSAANGKDGTLSDIVAEGVRNGALHVPVDGVKVGDVYVVDLWIDGEPGGVAEVIWRTGGPFNWKLGRHSVTVGGTDARGRCRCSRLFHAPDGADGLMFRVNACQPDASRAAFEDIAIYKVSSVVSGAPLFNNGKSAWSVAVPKNAARPICYAAEELTKTIAKISGASLPVISADRAPVDNVIRLIQADDRQEDVFLVKTHPNAIELKGSSPRAVLFAAYAFLRDHIGARWYWPGSDGEFLPPIRRFDVTESEKEYRSPFTLREMSICGIPGHRHEDTERWFAKQFLNSGLNSEKVQSDLGLVRITNGHYVSLPGKEGARKRLFASHPDWFSMLNGRRDMKGLAGCWSNEGYFNYVVSNLVGLVRSRKADIANLFPADIVPRCECHGCTRNPDLSARWWNFYARIIDAMCRELPDQRFAGIAYMEYRAVPGIKVKNLDYVEYCHYNRCYFHSLGDSACKMNARSMTEFRSWAEQAPLGLYGYEFDIFRGSPYLPLWRVLADEMRIFRDMGLKRVKTEYGVDMHRLIGKSPLPRSQIGQLSCRLSYYVWAALAFDPSLDEKVLVRDFCQHVYGAGAEDMTAYHELMADSWSRMPKHVTYFNNEMRNFADVLISLDLEKSARRHLVAATAAVKGDVRASKEVALDAECLESWVKAAKSARTGGVVYELKDVLNEDGFAAVGWLDAKARSGKAQPTRFKVLRGMDALHILAECEEKENAAFDRGSTEHDKSPFNWEATSIELFMDVGDGASRQIAIMPAGGVWDAKDGDMSWNSGLKARPVFTKDKWSLEMSIPYAGLGGAPKSGDRWKLMIIRNAERGSEFASCGWPVNAHRDFSSAATLVF